MTKDAILIFDIGKTNKKVLLFDKDLNVISEQEDKFEEILDDDGFACDDIEKIEAWMESSASGYLKDPAFRIAAVNITTYGATLMYLDDEGKRLTPVYNYLKPMPEGVAEPLYEKYGGVDEFSRKTASPALGMLNSGLQALWLKKKKPEVFGRVRSILHFPQYLSYKLTGQVSCEHTSVGCHTALWDFDNSRYHDWVKEEGLPLPGPVSVEQVFPASGISSDVPVGIGVHDSSASLVPYFMHTAEEFILVSTGTWCISMNPFNHSPLTTDQLRRDCLAYLSIQQKPVKSSRLFLGHIHDVNVKHLSEFYGASEDAYKNVTPDASLLKKMEESHDPGQRFFSKGLPEDYVDLDIDPGVFGGFAEAYHRLMIDLADLTAASIRLIVAPEDRTKNIYITGGFAKNNLFVNLIADRFADKKVFTSEIANATSLGAALILWKSFGTGRDPVIDLGLKRIMGI